MFDRKTLINECIALAQIYFMGFEPSCVGNVRRELGIEDSKQIEFVFSSQEMFDSKVLKVIARELGSGDISVEYEFVFSRKYNFVGITKHGYDDSNRGNCSIDVNMGEENEESVDLKHYWENAINNDSKDYWLVSGMFAYQLDEEKYFRACDSIHYYRHYC